MKMNKSLPLVSILIPTYNQPEFFKQTLESALAQDYPNIEILVSDDSTDDRVEKVASEYKDRIRFLKHDTRGISIGDRVVANLENLLENSRGDFINILYHDDLIYPNKISRMMEFFLDKDLKDQLAIVSSLRHVIDGSGKKVDTPDLMTDLNIPAIDGVTTMPGEAVGRMLLALCGNFIGELSTVLIRREDFYRSCVRKLSPGYCFGVRDRTMWDVSTYLEACRDGRGLAVIREPLSAFRMSGRDQNTFRGDVRIDIIVDWLAIATACYLQDAYIHNLTEFKASCRYWLFIANQMLSFWESYPDAQISTDSDTLDQILQAVESVQNKNYEATLKIGVDWIKKYSSDTFDSRYLS